MKRKFLFLIFALLFSFSCIDDVYALSGKFKLSTNLSTSSVATNTKFNVYVDYTGDLLGSLNMQVTFSNATCTLYSQAEGYTRKCNDSGCKIKFEDYENGYKSGTRFATFACTATTSPAKFSASIVNGDSWGGTTVIDGKTYPTGEEYVSVSGASLSLTVKNTTTKSTTNKSTTTTKKSTTTTKKETTKSTTKSTTKGSTTTTKIISITNTTRRPTTPRVTSSTQSNVVITIPTAITTTTTKEVVTTSINYLPDNMKLKELKIVGYDIDFNKNNTGYKIEVADNVTEVYVIATPNDNDNLVENTGVVNIEGLSSFSVRVYNEDIDQEVIYNIKLIRAKTSTLGVLYTKYFKPIVALLVILVTLFFLGVYFTHRRALDMLEVDDEDDEVISRNGELIVPKTLDKEQERIDFFKSPNIQISTDVPITTLQAKRVSINRKKKEVLEKKLNEVGIEEIPDNEMELTKVIISLNDTKEVEKNIKPEATRVIIDTEAADDKINSIKARIKEKEDELENSKTKIR